MSSFDEPPLGESPVVDAPSCRLLGPTALIVQGIMGVLVILSLVYKRTRESPRRPWRIWLFDVSKQIVGQMFVHGVNVMISDVLQRISSGNACVFYFLNILVDTTLGVGIIYVVLHGLTNLATKKFHWAGFQSGEYGSPPSANFWLRQAAVYVSSITTMKLLVVALFALWPGIFQVGQWLLSWTGDGSNFQIIFTMGLFPIIMNIIQFWLIDSIVKAGSPPTALALPTDTSRDSSILDREPLFRSSQDDDEDDEGEQPSRQPRDLENNVPRSRSPRKESEEPHNKSDSESKSTGSGSGTITPGTGSQPSSSFATHAYPPSITASTVSPSISSTRARASPSASPARRLSPLTTSSTRASKRRSPPPPLLPRSPMQPALNSPFPAFEDAGRAYHPQSQATVPAGVLQQLDAAQLPLVEEKTDDDAGGATKEWDLSWESEDWAERVGEEEWTGRRVEAAKGFVGSVWEAPQAIRVG